MKMTVDVVKLEECVKITSVLLLNLTLHYSEGNNEYTDQAEIRAKSVHFPDSKTLPFH